VAGTIDLWRELSIPQSRLGEEAVAKVALLGDRLRDRA